MANQTFINIKNCRISFPDLFKKAIVNGEEGTFGATFLLEKKEHVDVINAIELEIERLIKTDLKGAKIPAEKRCLKNGADTARPEYDGYLVLSARSQNRPITLKPNSKQEANDMHESGIYSGCRVDVRVALWAQNNGFGKRINAQLVTVRFRDDDEAFGGGHVDRDVALEGFEVDENDDFLNDDLDEAA